MSSSPWQVGACGMVSESESSKSVMTAKCAFGALSHSSCVAQVEFCKGVLFGAERETWMLQPIKASLDHGEAGPVYP
jgi:hypothetical protein